MQNRVISKVGRNTSSKSDCFLNPSARQNECAFCYIATGEDIITLAQDKAVLLRALLAGLIVLGMTILVCLVITIRSIPILLLLVLPLLQQLTTSEVQKRIHAAYPPHLWVRGYSPRPNHSKKRKRRKSICETKRTRSLKKPSRSWDAD